MSETPSLKALTGNIKFKTSTGYQSQQVFQGQEAHECALSMIGELARILAISGRGDDAIKAAQAACQRVGAA